MSVVIPVLDPGPMLFECLDSLRPHDDLQVIVVDNGSVDGMVDQAKAVFPEVCVLRNETNEGFSRACNRGAGEARGRYVLFLNSDAIVSHDGVKQLVRVADADPDAAFWGPIILSPDGGVDNSGEFFTWAGFFIRSRHLPPSESPPYAAFSCTAACALVRRDVFADLGGFRDDYFAYVEDVDLCWRARLAGWEIRVVPSVQATHVRSATSRRIFTPHEIRYISFRNRFRTILANCAITSLMRAMPMYVLSCVAIAVAYLISGRWRSTVAVAQALVWPLTHVSEMRAQRREAQARRRRGDRAILRKDLVAPFVSSAGWRLLREHFRWWERISAADVAKG